MGFGAYLNSPRVSGVGDWSDFFSGVAAPSTADVASDSVGGAIGTTLGNLINVATPSLLNKFVYGQSSPTPAPPTSSGGVKYTTDASGKLVPVQSAAPAVSGTSMASIALIAGGALLLFFALSKKK